MFEGTKRVGVCGFGIMGSGIMQVFAEAGFKTVGMDINREFVDKGMRGIASVLSGRVAKGNLEATRADEVLGRITGTIDITDLRGCDLVIEAVTEDITLKKNLFIELDKICQKDTILATNTSSFSIAELASCTHRPGKVVGMHFFNPVPVMKLVEIVRSLVVDRETIEIALDITRSIGKEPIIVKDQYGFVVNILLTPYFVGAIRLWEQGIAGIEDIDKAMKLGTGYPMGPFTLLDMAGLDTMVNAFQNLYQQYGDKEYAPPQILKKMVELGFLGRKSGKGFYDYSSKPPKPTQFNI